MGYLLSNFLSPFTNTAQADRYGGDLEGRGRFMVELLQRDARGGRRERMLWVRLNGAELMDEHGGNNEEECLEFMKMAERAGVDGISLVVGWHESNRGALGRDVPSDGWLRLAEAAKQAVSVPIAFGPRFGDPRMAEAALARGEFDFWEVCRPMLADPLLVHKLAHDAPDDIRPCLGGLVCLSRMFRNLPYICTMNPRLGHEFEPAMEVQPAQQRRRVLVIGGGPAGLEAAFVAARRRGHEVELWERRAQTRRSIAWPRAARSAAEQIFLRLIDYYERELKRTGVTVRLETEASGRAVSAFAPDVCILATGAGVAANGIADERSAKASPSGAPTTPTILRPPSVSSCSASTARRSSPPRASPRKAHRCDDAHRGRPSTRGMSPRRSSGATPPGSRSSGITILRDAWADGWDESGKLRLRWAPETEKTKGQERPESLELDLLVIGGRRVSDQRLVQDLEYRADVLRVIGDAVHPASIGQAVHGAYRTAIQI